MSGLHRVQLDCPAKVNLALSIGGPRTDGLHPIASWFVTISFGDTLTIEATDEPSSFDIRFADDAPLPGKVDWLLDKDLGVRAHRLLEQTAGRWLPIRATLEKRTPAGAGLGGGSSDAAAMLVAVDRLYALHLGEPRLIELAATLGSDVPFFVSAQHDGKTSAIVTGVGEAIQAAPRREPIHLALILPGVHCQTGAVYKTFDATHPQAPPPDLDRVRFVASLPTLSPDSPFNDLAEPALIVRPELRTLRDDLAVLLGRAVHVSGSGSSLFVVATSAAEAKDLAAVASAKAGCPALAVQTG